MADQAVRPCDHDRARDTSTDVDSLWRALFPEQSTLLPGERVERSVEVHPVVTVDVDALRVRRELQLGPQPCLPTVTEWYDRSQVGLDYPPPVVNITGYICTGPIRRTRHVAARLAGYARAVVAVSDLARVDPLDAAHLDYYGLGLAQADGSGPACIALAGDPDSGRRPVGLTRGVLMRQEELFADAVSAGVVSWSASVRSR